MTCATQTASRLAGRMVEDEARRRLQRYTDRSAQAALDEQQRREFEAGKVPNLIALAPTATRRARVGLVAQAVAEQHQAVALAHMTPAQLRRAAQGAIEAYAQRPDEQAMARAVYIAQTWPEIMAGKATDEAQARALAAVEWDNDHAPASPAVRAGCLAFAKTLIGTRDIDLDRKDQRAQLAAARSKALSLRFDVGPLDAAMLTPREQEAQANAAIMLQHLQTALPDHGWACAGEGQTLLEAQDYAAQYLSIGANTMAVYIDGQAIAAIPSSAEVVETVRQALSTVSK